MSLPKLFNKLALPAIGSPMFIVSSPEFVVAQCCAGIVGTMPSLNVREPHEFETVLAEMHDAIEAFRIANPNLPTAPFGVNLIAHRSNARLEHDLEACIRRRVPLIITSLGPSASIVDRVKSYGGLVFHDVTTGRHARKAASVGVDGLIAVSAGAGGHGGTLSPFALLAEIKNCFDGTVVMAGSITKGSDVAAVRAMGADMAYIGTRLIATREASARPEYKNMIVDSTADDIFYSSFFSGVPANYLKASIIAAGLDPATLASRSSDTMRIGEHSSKPKAWKDIWGAGQGVGAISDIPPVAELVARLVSEYCAATQALAADSFAKAC